MRYGTLVVTDSLPHFDTITIFGSLSTISTLMSRDSHDDVGTLKFDGSIWRFDTFRPVVSLFSLR
jgi:hypothetical protein